MNSKSHAHKHTDINNNMCGIRHFSIEPDEGGGFGVSQKDNFLRGRGVRSPPH